MSFTRKTCIQYAYIGCQSSIVNPQGQINIQKRIALEFLVVTVSRCHVANLMEIINGILSKTKENVNVYIRLSYGHTVLCIRHYIICMYFIHPYPYLWMSCDGFAGCKDALRWFLHSWRKPAPPLAAPLKRLVRRNDLDMQIHAACLLGDRLIQYLFICILL